MPQQSYPPYAAGAQTCPRMLQVWLDVNAQNGALRRAETYITLPAFSATPNWVGVNDIITAFNFEGPNNFSLRCKVVAPAPTVATPTAITIGQGQLGVVIGAEGGGIVS